MIVLSFILRQTLSRAEVGGELSSGGGALLEVSRPGGNSQVGVS